MVEKFNLESIKFEYPRYCNIGITIKIPPNTASYLYESFQVVLEEELKEGKIQELEIVNGEIIIKLIKSKDDEYLLPDSIRGISDYFPPSPDTYKIFINIYANKENYGNRFLVCGYQSGLEIDPVFEKENIYIWNIFGKCYLLEKHNDEIKIYELNIRLVKDENGKIQKIKLLYSLLPENIIDNQNLIETIKRFREGQIKQDVNQ